MMMRLLAGGLVLLLAGAAPGAAQMEASGARAGATRPARRETDRRSQQPFRGTPVPSPLEAGLGQVDIHVSALMERLLGVDDSNYRFESLLYFYLR